MSDVTQPESVEQARIDTERRDLFLAMLAHDLRTPLNAIILTAATEVRHSEGRQRSAAARVLRCAERMKHMTADLLEFARVRVGRGLPVRPERFDLARLAREIGEDVEVSHPGSRVRVEADAEVEGEWDRPRMGQVLTNLVCNAIQHGRLGTAVDVRLARQTDGVRIDVVNQGDPIPESEMPTLFEPFARGRSTRAKPESVGLGLFIVREIVAAHGGEVLVFNGPDGGTVIFAVRLPLHSETRE